jgi:L-threonylcarbamoyladenylate synthase
MAQAIARLVQVDDESIEEAGRMVLAGRLVAYPTDTVYGLGCNPLDEGAVDRLTQAKQRPKGALPILVNSMAAARKLGEFNKTSLGLAGRFWPGPLTLIVPLREKLPIAVTDGSLFVGLRIPKHETALNLIDKCGGRIIGTSANISGHPSPRTADDVVHEIGGRIDLILDGGPSPLGKESTVAKVLGGQVDVLREGAVSREEIHKVLRAQ